MNIIILIEITIFVRGHFELALTGELCHDRHATTDQQQRTRLHPGGTARAGGAWLRARLRASKVGSGISRPDHARTCRLSSPTLDTAFLGTTSAAGAPYIQHRGGPKGFIKVIDEHTLGFADYAGNRQYITLSNLAENDRAFLFLLDFAGRQRIKVWGRARVVEDDPALLARLSDPGYRARPERAILFTVEAWDVNCSQHITARFSEERGRGGDRRAARKDRRARS